MKVTIDIDDGYNILSLTAIGTVMVATGAYVICDGTHIEIAHDGKITQEEEHAE